MPILWQTNIHIMRRKILVLLILSLLSSHLVKVHAQAPIALFLKVKENDQFKVVQTLTQDINQEMMGQQISMSQSSEMKYLYDIVSTNADQVVIKATFQAVKMDMTMPQGNLSIDTQEPVAADNPLKPMADMVDKSFLVYLTPLGKVQKVEGINALFEGTENASMIAQFFNDEAMAKSFEALFKIYPERPVSKGDEWSNVVEMNMNNMLTESNNVYTFQDLTEGQAVIGVKSTVNVSTTGDDQALGMDVSYDMKGTQSGTIFLDLDTGMANDLQLQQHISGKITAQGMEVPMTIKTANKLLAEKL